MNRFQEVMQGICNYSVRHQIVLGKTAAGAAGAVVKAIGNAVVFNLDRSSGRELAEFLYMNHDRVVVIETTEANWVDFDINSIVASVLSNYAVVYEDLIVKMKFEFLGQLILAVESVGRIPSSIVDWAGVVRSE